MDSPINWRVKLQEGKDHPKNDRGMPRFPYEFENNTKTSALMLEMTKLIHNIGKVVTMDSRFCVAPGILALHDVGVFGQALIKKRGRFWPKYVPGNQIDEYMKDKPLGYAATLKQCIDGKGFLVHCQKDDCYVTKILSRHGLIQTNDDTTPTGTSMAHGKASDMWSQCHATTIQNTGLTMSIISAMIPLVWRKFGQQSGGPLDNSHSSVLLQK